MKVAFAALVGYLLGAIPFGLLITRALSGRDPRQVGSGNIGATNALRTAGRKAGALTLALDVGKGAAAVWIAKQMSISEVVWAAAAGGAFLGHLFPVWLRFRGGKGVATMFGVLIPWAWAVAAVAFAVWLAALWRVRIVSVASLMAAWSLPLLAWALHPTPALVAFAFVAAVFVTIRHRDNIARLRRGEEPTIAQDRAAREAELR